MDGTRSPRLHVLPTSDSGFLYPHVFCAAGHAIPIRGGTQEMPPPGGFPNVKYARAVPGSRGPTGPMLYCAAVFAVVYGFYMIGQTNIANRKYKLEKRNARIAIMPLLQAEEDASYVIARKAQVEREADIMKNIPGERSSC